MLKTCRTILTTMLILLIGSCALLFALYKIVLDKPGFFRQFEDDMAIREYLLNELAVGEVSRDYAIEFMSERLSIGESCGSLRDSDLDDSYCFQRECPPVSLVTVNTEITFFVRGHDVLREYGIILYFEHEILIDIYVWILTTVP